MKVEIVETENSEQKLLTAAALENGQVGEFLYGDYIYRNDDGVYLVISPDRIYKYTLVPTDAVLKRILPVGTKIVLTVTE